MDDLLGREKRDGGDDDGTRASKPPRSTVLLPLYIYPLAPDSWQPLHTAIRTHPSLDFVIIINPHNGPGATPFPDQNYATEIPKLNAYPNVRTVGYVRTDYCRRDLRAVCDDIARYAGWSEHSTTTTTASVSAGGGGGDDRVGKHDDDDSSNKTKVNLGVKGIFFDETPNLYSAKVSVYLNSITRHVKSMHGILGQRLVIHNPGTVPDPNLVNPGPDVTAILEGGYDLYQNSSTKQRIGDLLRYERDRCCYIVHSVPRGNIEALVKELRFKAKYIFVTDVAVEGVYTRFGPGWGDFVDAMASS